MTDSTVRVAYEVLEDLNAHWFELDEAERRVRMQNALGVLAGPLLDDEDSATDEIVNAERGEQEPTPSLAPATSVRLVATIVQGLDSLEWLLNNAHNQSTESWPEFERAARADAEAAREALVSLAAAHETLAARLLVAVSFLSRKGYERYRRHTDPTERPPAQPSLKGRFCSGCGWDASYHPNELKSCLRCGTALPA